MGIPIPQLSHHLSHNPPRRDALFTFSLLLLFLLLLFPLSLSSFSLMASISFSSPNPLHFSTRFSYLLYICLRSTGHRLSFIITLPPIHLPLLQHTLLIYSLSFDRNPHLLSFIFPKSHIFMDPKTVSELHHIENPENNENQNNPQMGPPPPPPPSHPSNQSFTTTSNFHHFQHYPHAFSSNYVSQPVFPMMVEQNVVNNGVPTSLMGGFFDGVHPYKPVTQHRLVNTLRIQRPKRWGSSITKAARSKRKMVRQRSLNSASSRLFNTSSGCTINGSSSSRPDLSTVTNHNNGDNDHIYTFITPDNKRLKIILQKELRNSDVNSLGRIVLPKKDSEANLPSLTVKEGIQISIREVHSTKVWFMRYRYWPNNKSRMYVLENTGEFVKENGLKSGDFVTLYQDEHKQLYISSKKAETLALVEEPRKEENESLTTLDKEVKENPTEEDQRPPAIVEASNQKAIEVEEPSSSSNDLVMDGDVLCFDSSIFLDFNDCDWSELDMLPNFDDCDLSLYDDLVKDLNEDHDTGDKDNPAASTPNK